MSGWRKPESNRASAWWLDVELIAYSLLGLFVVVLGLNALATWAIAQWVSGMRAAPLVACIGLLGLTALLLVAIRPYRRFFVVTAVLAGIGAVCFVLGSFGFSLPPSWIL